MIDIPEEPCDPEHPEPIRADATLLTASNPSYFFSTKDLGKGKAITVYTTDAGKSVVMFVAPFSVEPDSIVNDISIYLLQNITCADVGSPLKS